jgi:transposase
VASEKARATVSGNAAKAILLKSTGRTVPYGWQFPGEDICFLSEKSYKFNYFGLINRQSQCYWQVTEENINTEFILNFLEQLSFKISRTTFIVLDNARIHKTKDSRQRIPYWQKRGLFLFFLPPYSPHLNIAETLWRELKKEWLDPKDYLSKDTLGYALNRCMADMGNGTNIKFSHFNAN